MCTCSQNLLPKQEQWQSYMNGYVDDFIEATYCDTVAHPSLNHGAGYMVKTKAIKMALY